MRAWLLAVVLAIGLACASTDASAAPVQWTVGSGGNGHWYESITTPVTWQNALTSAAGSTYLGMQGYLATITSAGENAFVAGLLGANAQAWIAGTDQVTEGVWTWAAGPETGQIFYGPGAPVGAYSQWRAFEPNDCCGGEDYVALNTAYNDWVDGNGPNTYVVEYSSAIPAPAGATLMALGVLSLAVVRFGSLRRA